MIFDEMFRFAQHDKEIREDFVDNVLMNTARIVNSSEGVAMQRRVIGHVRDGIGLSYALVSSPIGARRPCASQV